ncbi:MAG TPA: AraC family transcriptional regulator [Kofleriaceae bacterium]
MAHQVELVPVAAPGLKAARSRGDELYVGLKDTFMVSRMAEGRTRFWTHGREWRAVAGSVVIQQPGDVHREVERDGVATYEILRIDPSLVAEAYADVRLNACLPPDDTRAQSLHALLDAIAAGADRFTIDCALAEAIGTMIALEQPRKSHTFPVRRALAMIRERFAETVTLDELATHARLDKFHLCRAFRDQVGMPPHAYQIQLRIMHAKLMLASGAKPKDIAPRVGLYDQSQLNRHFRRIVGMTPGQFAAANG